MRTSVTREDLSRTVAHPHCKEPAKQEPAWKSFSDLLDPTLRRCSRLVPVGGGPGENPGHSGGTTLLSRLGTP